LRTRPGNGIVTSAWNALVSQEARSGAAETERGGRLERFEIFLVIETHDRQPLAHITKEQHRFVPVDALATVSHRPSVAPILAALGARPRRRWSAD
jgi:hypothetical protein